MNTTQRPFNLLIQSIASYFASRTYVVLSFILIFSVFPRFFFLESLPVSLYWDEVAMGYNAYSVLETGRDEYGHFLPLLFESYNDFKMPIYIYLTTIPIALFGLTEFSVRVLSALAGVLTVLMSFLVTRELLFYSGKKKTILPLFVAFLLTISPWHLQFSRAGFEANLALLFITIGVYFLLLALKRPIFLIPATIIFALSCYTYRSEIVFTPLFFITLLFLLRKKLDTRKIVMSIVGFLLLVSPLAVAFSGGDQRASQVVIFTERHPQVVKAVEKRQAANDALWAKLLYNRRLVYTEVAISQYISHYLPDFLFFKGDTNMRHTVSGNGLFYLWQLPFLLLGLIAGFTTYKHAMKVLIPWIAFAPLAASVSTPAPHALRSLPMLIPLLIVIVIGLEKGYYLFSSYRYRISFILLLLVILPLSGITFAKAYSYHNGVLAAGEWGDGYRQLLSYVKEHEEKYEKVIISGHYWQPYMYTLFYTKYDPVAYQKNGSSIAFDKYYFGGTSWDRDRGRNELDNADFEKIAKTRNVLIALSPQEYVSQEKSLERLTEIRDHSGKVVFIISTLR